MVFLKEIHLQQSVLAAISQCIIIPNCSPFPFSSEAQELAKRLYFLHYNKINLQPADVFVTSG